MQKSAGGSDRFPTGISIEEGFGLSVRDARKRVGLTQRQLADRVGLDASAISRLEQGARAVRLGEAVLIAEALHANIRELIYGLDENIRAMQTGVARLLSEAATAGEAARTSILEYLDKLDEVYRILSNEDVRSVLGSAAILESIVADAAPDSEIVKALRNALSALKKSGATPKAELT